MRSGCLQGVWKFKLHWFLESVAAHRLPPVASCWHYRIISVSLSNLTRHRIQMRKL